MNLRVYDPSNVPQIVRKKPAISISSVGGRIFFNESLCELLDLKHGDAVTFLQDDKNIEDWFITKDEKGFMLTKCDSRKGLYIYNANLVQKIVPESNTVCYRVASECTSYNGMKIYAILTSSSK